MKNLLPPSSLKLLYNSFIQPHIQYVQVLWGGCNGQNKQRIVAIQKRAIRTVTKAYYMDHTEPRMKKIGLLRFDDLYRQQCLVLIHDSIYKKAPETIQQLIQLDHDSSRYMLRNQVNNPLNLKIPNLKTRVGSHSYCVKGPSFWNEIPNELKKIEKREIFKNSIKRFFLHKYNKTSECNNPRCRDHRHHC